MIPAINSCLLNFLHGSGWTILVPGVDCDSTDVVSYLKLAVLLLHGQLPLGGLEAPPCLSPHPEGGIPESCMRTVLLVTPRVRHILAPCYRFGGKYNFDLTSLTCNQRPSNDLPGSIDMAAVLRAICLDLIPAPIMYDQLGVSREFSFSA